MSISLDSLRGRRVYLDANVLIYYLDGTLGPAGEAARSVVIAAANGDFRAITGHAAVAEVMAGPYRTGDAAVIRSVREFFRQPRLLELVPHAAQAFDDAAMLRGTQDMPLIDALHIATAASAGCGAIVTNDSRMQPALGVEVIALRSVTA